MSDKLTFTNGLYPSPKYKKKLESFRIATTDAHYFIDDLFNMILLNKYIQKLSDYHRIDLSTSYKMNFKHWHTQIGFTVFNLFDRVNVKYRQFIYQLPPGQGSNSQQNTIVGSDISQLERTYNLTFSFGWK